LKILVFLQGTVLIESRILGETRENNAMATEEGIFSLMGERVDADALIRNPRKNSLRKDSLPCHRCTSGSEMNPGSAQLPVHLVVVDGSITGLLPST